MVLNCNENHTQYILHATLTKPRNNDLRWNMIYILFGLPAFSIFSSDSLDFEMSYFNIICHEIWILIWCVLVLTDPKTKNSYLNKSQFMYLILHIMLFTTAMWSTSIYFMSHALCWMVSLYYAFIKLNFHISIVLQLEMFILFQLYLILPNTIMIYIFVIVVRRCSSALGYGKDSQ